MLLIFATLTVFAAIILAVGWLSIGHVVLPEGDKMGSRGSAYVESWGQAPTEHAVNSVRIGGIGASAFGKQLRIKVVSRDGRSVLDALSWKIDAQVSPALNLATPISNDSIGAVLIAIE